MQATRQYIDALATGLATTSGVKLVESENWTTNIRTKEIFYNPADLLGQDHITVKGLILHEVAHVQYTSDTTKTTELQKKYPVMQEIYNVFEDIRIEYQLRSEYGRYAEQALDSVHGLGAELQNDFVDKNPELPTLNKHLLLPLMNDIVETATTNSTANIAYSVIQKIRGSFSDDDKVKASNIERVTDHNRRIRYCKSIDELKDFVDNNIYPILEEYIKAHKSETEQMAKEGKPTPKIDPHGTQKPKATQGKGMTKRGDTHALTPDESRSLLAPYINTLSQKLNDILKEKEATRYEGNHITGKLLSKNAFKVVTGDSRIFSRKDTPNKPKYAITLVLDESGSMRDSTRHVDTYHAGLLLEAVCKKLNFPLNTYIYGNDVKKVKSVVEYQDIEANGNQDATAIKAVNEGLDTTLENIVFVLTDGGVCEDPRPELALLRKRGATVIAIGVGLTGKSVEDLRYYYGSTIEAPQTEKLPAIIVSQIQRLIHR